MYSQDPGFPTLPPPKRPPEGEGTGEIVVGEVDWTAGSQIASRNCSCERIRSRFLDLTYCIYFYPPMRMITLNMETIVCT
jgi:hypothetical protein